MVYVCLFRFYRPTQELFTHMETSPLAVYRWRATIFDICSALMVIEHLRFCSVPHLLWHGASVYNGHLRGPVPLTPIAELLAVELTLSIFTTYVCCGLDFNTQPSTCGVWYLKTVLEKKPVNMSVLVWRRVRFPNKDNTFRFSFDDDLTTHY